MSYPLTDTARRVWERIQELVSELLRVPHSRRYLLALAAGDRPEEFPSSLLVELQALSDEHWSLIGPMIPESCTDGLDLSRQVLWTEVLRPTGHDPAIVRKLRWMFFSSLGRAASYLLERDRAARLRNDWPEAASDKQGEPIQSQSGGNDVGIPGGTETRKPRTKRGRKPDTDPKEDKRITEAWAAGQYRTFADLERELKLEQGEGKRAVDRHRKRK